VCVCVFVMAIENRVVFLTSISNSLLLAYSHTTDFIC
jgi:hypothetical protein